MGNIINFKGSFKTSITRTNKKKKGGGGLTALFALKSRFFNVETLPVNVCKLFDILTRPVPLYNCDVWFPEEYKMTVFVTGFLKNTLFCKHRK